MVKDIPQKMPGDHAHDAIRTCLSLFSGPAATIFSTLVSPPIAKRQREWQESIMAEIERLEMNVQQLSCNETFISALLIATQAAMKTNQPEKLTRLKSAVLNSSNSQFCDENMNLFFLNTLESFSVAHIKVLEYFNNPVRWYSKLPDFWPINQEKYFYDHLSKDLYDAFRGEREDFLFQVYQELIVKGFLIGGSVIPERDGNYDRAEPRTTNLGKDMLSFWAEN